MGYRECLATLIVCNEIGLILRKHDVGYLGEVAGAKNYITVINHSSLFDDLLDDIAPVVPYEVNGITFEKGYYLPNGIYPQWTTFVKSFTVARDEKNAVFKRQQARAWKVVERAFGVLQDRLTVYLNAWSILKSYPKWDAVKSIDEDNLAELFGPDPRARPAGKPRPAKKAKTVDTSSAGGSQSESLTGVISQDYRRRCEDAEAAYKVKRKKELGLLECRELEFLVIDPSSLPSKKIAYIRRKQDEIKKNIQTPNLSFCVVDDML
nr:protein ALP1-like isoform X1 [Tanacetum cinerariifolium]